jgi:hypothetical protein
MVRCLVFFCQGFCPPVFTGSFQAEISSRHRFSLKKVQKKI